MPPRSSPVSAVAIALIHVFAAAFAAGCATAPRRFHPRAVELEAQGAESLSRGKLDQAAGEFSLALEFEPRMATARNGLGLVALSRGDDVRAEAELRQALAFDEELVEAHQNLGQIAMRHGDVDEALDHYKKALAIDPGYGMARLAAAEALLRQGKLEEARWQLAKLCALEPGSAEAHAAHALVLARLGRTTAAEGAAQRALEIDPDLPAAHRARAEILAKGRDFVGAIEEIRVVIARLPGSVDDRIALATNLTAADRLDEAMGVLTALEEAAPRRAEVAFLRAYVDLRRDRHAEALVASERALALRPRYPQALLLHAEALVGVGRPGEGRRELERFLSEAPPGLEAERSAAVTYLKASRD